MTHIQIGSLVDRTVDAEGPGPRFVIWTQGCTLGCPGCCNPHLWNPAGGEGWSVADLLARIEAAQQKHGDLEGITLVGGEPFEQDAPLAELCAQVRARGLTVFAFTGHLREALEAQGSALLEHCDLLVDGLYVEAERTTTRRWIGSNNQRLHFLTDAYRPDDPRFSEPNQAEIRYDHTGAITVVGFPFDSVLEAFGPKSEAAKAARKLKLAEPTP